MPKTWRPEVSRTPPIPIPISTRYVYTTAKIVEHPNATIAKYARQC